MSIRSTLLLAILVVLGLVVVWYGPALGPLLHLAPRAVDGAGAGSIEILEKELTPAKVTRIEIRRAEGNVILENGNAGWSLPGQWPTRPVEVRALVARLTSLRSRFVPIAVESDWAPYGLTHPDVTVVLKASGKDITLAFGEEKPAANDSAASEFTRATFVRVDDKPEVVRLEPGIIAQLDKPAEYYQQRQLFPSDLVKKAADSSDRVEQVTAVGLDAKQALGNARYLVIKTGDAWQMKEPVVDQVDPDKVNGVLAAIPDVWAEKFVDNPPKDLAEYGLKDPEQTLSVTLPGGDVRILQIGKISGTKVRHVLKQPPPGLGPQPPRMETETDEFRFAKLQNNNQIFEIKTNRLKDIFLPYKDLRDPRLARFESRDVDRVEVMQPESTLVFVKDKDRWKMEKPQAADAEESKITELLDKLSRLEARDADVIDSKDLKAYGLDKPTATIKIAVQEEIKGDKDKKKIAKSFSFILGKDEGDKKKVYVRVAGWERINAVEDSLAPLAKRSELAYRRRRVLDFTADAVDTIEIHRPGEVLTLKQDKGSWKLTAPSPAEVDSLYAGQLASALANLEAVEYVSQAPKPEELEKEYGLAKPGLSATISFTDKAKPPVTLQIGKERAGKGEYFAKTASSPGVFVLRKDTYASLDKSSLSYRPLQIWQVGSTEVKSLKIQKQGEEEYSLTSKAGNWDIGGPFTAPALGTLAQPMIQELSGLHAERYEAHAAKGLAAYGLDKPYLRVTLVEAASKEDKPKAGEPAKTAAPAEKVLLLGKTLADNSNSRFAKVGAGDAVFVVGSKFVAAIDHKALDLLDTKLLTLAPAQMERLQAVGGEQSLVLQKKGADWKVTRTPAPEFTADPEVMNQALGVWSRLQAEKYAAYGDKAVANLAAFGLDKPTLTLSVKIQPPEADGKKPPLEEHIIALGKPVGQTEERYARIDKSLGIAILGAATVKDLTHTYLDFVNRSIFSFEPESVTGITQKKGADGLHLVRGEDGWQIQKPAAAKADDESCNRLIDQMAHLRAQKVAAYPAQDLKPFGLDAPDATFTLEQKSAEGKPAGKTLNVGKVANPATGDRFAQATGSPAVVVIPGTLAKRLIGSPLTFRNRTLVRFADADKVTLERGSRKVTFAKVDGTWKVTQPLEGQAEQTDLEEFINEAARLQADELIAEKPADLKSYGLDKPEARWRFFSGEKEVLGLILGAKETNGSRVYAKLASGDLIFLLKPTLTTKSLAEYRSRTIWPVAPDASQVESLRYGYKANLFILDKVSGQWTVAGKPQAKLDSKKINDALAALAGLKVDHYVADVGADGQLYGLDKAELTLEIDAPSGKKTLLIGRPEGGSKRYYAQLPEKKGEVFTISEVDAAKIVKDLKGFEEEAKKVP